MDVVIESRGNGPPRQEVEEVLPVVEKDVDGNLTPKDIDSLTPLLLLYLVISVLELERLCVP